MESTFLTAFRVVTRVPLVPIDKFRSMDLIGSVRCPVLVIHGLDDWVISPWHGEKLYELAPEPKMCLWVPGAGHNDVVKVAREEYGKTMKNFRCPRGRAAGAEVHTLQRAFAQTLPQGRAVLTSGRVQRSDGL